MNFRFIFYFDKDSVPKIEFSCAGVDDWTALYYTTSKKIKGNITLSFDANIKTVEGFKNTMARIASAVRHETQHLGQQILQITQKLKRPAGLPSPKLQEKTYTPAGKTKIENQPPLDYELTDIEYYPNLQDAIESFIKELPYKENKQEFFKFWIGDENTSFNPIYSNYQGVKFFKMLKEKNSLKWQKAVKELYKAFKEKMFQLAMGQEK